MIHKVVETYNAYFVICFSLIFMSHLRTANAGYEYLGCYADASDRALRYGPGASGGSNYNAATCSTTCSDLGYTYFALQYYGECYCDNDYDHATKYGVSTNCPDSRLGGGWANDLFEITSGSFPDQAGFTLSTGLQSSPLSTSDVASVTSGSVLNGVKYYRFYGWDSDHEQAAAILSAASSAADIEFIIEIVPSKINDLSYSDIDDLTDEWNDMVSYIYCIALGNEPLKNGNTFSILPTKLQMVYDRLQSTSGWENIPVSIPFSAEIFDVTYPVEDSTFKSDYKTYLASIISIYKTYGAPFSIQIYPFFTMLSIPQYIDYILGEESGGYSCMLGAQYMATYYAMNDALSNNGVEVIITETGWSTYSSDGSYWFATIDNANKYYQNTLRLMEDSSSELYNKRIYFFELFDEDLKSGGEHEQHFGFYDQYGDLKITYSDSSSAFSDDDTADGSDKSMLLDIISVCAVIVIVVIIGIVVGVWYYRKSKQNKINAKNMEQIEENEEEVVDEEEIVDEQEIEIVRDIEMTVTGNEGCR